MARTTSSITIQRPIEEVFAVLTDVEKSGLWFPGNVEEHWTSPPPHGVGSTRRAVVTMFGRRSENDAVTTVFDPPHRAGMRGTSPTAPFDAVLTFAPDGDGTQVEVTTAFHLRGWTRILAPVISTVYGWAWGRGLRTLKRMMESGEL
jgi:uncharacterized protein YndB with AHSA1/START domain